MIFSKEREVDGGGQKRRGELQGKEREKPPIIGGGTNVDGRNPVKNAHALPREQKKGRKVYRKGGGNDNHADKTVVPRGGKATN